MYNRAQQPSSSSPLTETKSFSPAHARARESLEQAAQVFSDQQQEIDQLHWGIEEREERLAAVGSARARLEWRLTHTERQRPETEERANVAEGRLGAAEERAAELEKRLAQIEQENMSGKRLLAEARQHVAAAEQQAATARERITAAEQQARVEAERTAAAETRAIEAEERLAEAKGGQETTESRAAPLGRLHQELGDKLRRALSRLNKMERKLAAANERSVTAETRATAAEDRAIEAENGAIEAEDRAIEAEDAAADYQRRYRNVVRPGVPRHPGGLLGFWDVRAGESRSEYVKKLEDLLVAINASLNEFEGNDEDYQDLLVWVEEEVDGLVKWDLRGDLPDEPRG